MEDMQDMQEVQRSAAGRRAERKNPDFSSGCSAD